jgi:hypothetical protein
MNMLKRMKIVLTVRVPTWRLFRVLMFAFARSFFAFCAMSSPYAFGVVRNVQIQTVKMPTKIELEQSILQWGMLADRGPRAWFSFP